MKIIGMETLSYCIMKVVPFMVLDMFIPIILISIIIFIIGITSSSSLSLSPMSCFANLAFCIPRKDIGLGHHPTIVYIFLCLFSVTGRTITGRIIASLNTSEHRNDWIKITHKQHHEQCQNHMKHRESDWRSNSMSIQNDWTIHQYHKSGKKHGDMEQQTRKKNTSQYLPTPLYFIAPW